MDDIINISFTKRDPMNSTVVDDATGGLLSAVSVTDVGRVVVPAQSNQILAMSLKQFVARIKVGRFFSCGAGGGGADFTRV